MTKAQRKTKIERLILSLPNLCDTGKKKAARRYHGLTLQQAWKKADTYHLKSICEALKVKPPVPCTIGCGENCWGMVSLADANAMRAMLKDRIPARVQTAYAKA